MEIVLLRNLFSTDWPLFETKLTASISDAVKCYKRDGYPRKYIVANTLIYIDLNIWA